MDNYKKGSEDLVLIKSITIGDKKAFDRLFKKYYLSLLNFAKELLTYPSDEAEDVVSEMFCSLWKNREQLQIKTSVTSYLYISVKNRVFDHYKKNNIVTSEFKDSDLNLSEPAYLEPHQLLVYKELEKRVLYLTAKLPKQTRVVYNLNREEGLSYLEIASILGISVNTVKTHLYRAIKFLKNTITITAD